MSLIGKIVIQALLLAGVSALFAGQPVTYAREAAELKMVSPKHSGLQTATIIFNAEGKQVIRLEKKNEKGFGEFSLSPVFKLPDFEKLSIRIHTGNADKLSNISLRLKDRDGETFQYTKNSPEIENHVICFLIDASAVPANSWGKKQNGKIDFPLVLSGMTFRFQKGKGCLEIQKIETEIIHSRMVPPSVRLHLPEHGFPFLNPKDKKAEIEVHNKTAVPIEAKISFKISKLDGTIIEQRKMRRRFSGGESVDIPFAIPPQYGVYIVKYQSQLMDGTKQKKEGNFRFASMIPSRKGERSRGEFYFGICAHDLIWYPFDRQKKIIAALSASGAGIVRVCSYWDLLEKTENQWTFESMDRIFNILEEYGLEMQIMHSRLPRWAWSKDWKPVSGRKRFGRACPDFGSWRKFNRKFSERYAGRIAFVEIWNEPDLFAFADFSIEDYLTLLKISAEEIRKVDPMAKILCGGFATIGKTEHPDIVRRTITEGRNDYDLFALHNHGTLPSCDLILNRYREIQKLCNDDKAFYITEAGLSTMIYGEMKQAAHTFQKPLYYWSRGAKAYNWYSLYDKGNNPGNNEHHFGLLYNNFEPKPSFVTYNMLTSLYGKAKFSRSVVENRNYTVLEFQKQKDFLFAAWNNLQNAWKQAVFFDGVAGKAFAVDLFGNEQELPVSDGLVLFEIGETPSSLKISGKEKAPRFLGRMIDFDDNFLVPGKKNRCTLILHNPSAKEQQVQLRFKTSPLLKILPEKETFQIFSRSSKRFPLVIEADSGYIPTEDDLLFIKFGDFPEKSIRLPFECVRILSRNRFLNTPDYIINRVRSGNILVPSVPEYAKYVWSGPLDLSAKVFLVLNREEFKMKIEVTDDVHCQSFSGADLWRGDSIQFTITPLGMGGATWRYTLAHHSGNGSEVYLASAPPNNSLEKSKAETTLRTFRDENQKKTIYEVSIPSKMLEIDKRIFRFNLLLNDNDGFTRESFLAIAPGIGREWLPDTFPLLKMQNGK